MDPKLELTKSQLETILRLINDVKLIGGKSFFLFEIIFCGFLTVRLN